VTTNVRTKPLKFLHETNYGCIMWYLTPVAGKLSLFQDN